MILYAPDQISELYRVIYANVCWNWRPGRFLRELSGCVDPNGVAGTVWLVGAGVVRIIWFYLTIFLIGVFIWFGANQVAAESVFRMKDAPASTVKWSLRLPALIGALPLIACALGQYFSTPENFGPNAQGVIDAIGDSAEPKAIKWADSVTAGLIFGSDVMGFLGLGLMCATYRLAKGINAYAREANEPYFYNKRFLLFVVLLFGGFTMAFVWWPVPFPQLLTVFGILALFTLCLVAFCLYFSLLTIEYRLPVISALLVYGFLLSVMDLNDNHTIRLIVPRGNAAQPQPVMKTAANEFEQWYASRPNLEVYDEYPVYIVAAQGGGMYAAYQTAIFLSRLQDNCPAFRNHLFAISAVSGGSVGAATFVSALKLAEQVPVANESQADPVGGLADPCPVVNEYYRAVQQRSRDNQDKKETTQEKSAETNDKPGRLEQIVRKTLGTDLLSPLVAATLFPDFGQRFIPYPFQSLDRARSLEMAFESATSEYDPKDKIRPFADSFLNHWKPAGSTPALFMNATDAGSGRRVLISPFALRGANGQSEDEATIQFPFYPKENPKAKEIPVSRVLDIALSTAAGISARFPWMTPAATIDVSDGRFGSKHRKIRLVDGGYVDNSGVETVLDLLQSIGPVREKIEDNAKNNRKLPDNRDYRKVRIILVVLSGGSYTERSSFALGETMEPIRGLLSARASRAYAAIERAQYVFQEDGYKTRGRDGNPMQVPITGLRKASLRNYSYQMPLGWVLSKRTREIIEDQSGYFSECDADEKFRPKSPKMPQSDCIHDLAYHLLNRSLGTKYEDIQQLNVAQAQPAFAPLGLPAAVSPRRRLDQTKMMACYRGKGDKSLSPVQVSSLQELLNIWDRNTDLVDDRWLASSSARLPMKPAISAFRSRTCHTAPPSGSRRYGPRSSRESKTRCPTSTIPRLSPTESTAIGWATPRPATVFAIAAVAW